MCKSGSVIFLNGASSSGKTTLARALQSRLPAPFLHYSIDHYRDANILPMDRIKSGEFNWQEMREAFFAGFHASIPSLADAGNNLILEHIVEDEAWLRNLVRLLSHADIFFVGVHCSLAELQRRERIRGDRPIGDARADFSKVHTHCIYDIEIDTGNELDDNIELLCSAWDNRSLPRAFDKLFAAE